MRHNVSPWSSRASARWLFAVLTVLLMLPLVHLRGVSAVGQKIPAGLTAADWSKIQALLPSTQQAYLKASNTGENDWFGRSVAVSGDTVVVSAEGEDSNATGVNGNQADNSAYGAGAAYVFVSSTPTATPTNTPTSTATTTPTGTVIATPTATPPVLRPRIYLPIIRL